MGRTEAVIVLVVSLGVIALGVFEVIKSEFVLDAFLERQLSFLSRPSALFVVKMIGFIMSFIGFVIAITSIVNLLH